MEAYGSAKEKKRPFQNSLKKIQKEISLPNLLKCKLRKNWVPAVMLNDLHKI